MGFKRVHSGKGLGSTALDYTFSVIVCTITKVGQGICIKTAPYLRVILV